MKTSSTTSPGRGKPMGSRGSLRWNWAGSSRHRYLCEEGLDRSPSRPRERVTTIPREPVGELSAARGPSRRDQMCLQSLPFSAGLPKEPGLCSAPCYLQSLCLCAGPFVTSGLQPLLLQQEIVPSECSLWLNRGPGTGGLHNCVHAGLRREAAGTLPSGDLDSRH